MTETATKYAKDPIIEAICELRLAQPGWDSERVAHALRDGYPVRSEQPLRRLKIGFDGSEFIGQEDKVTLVCLASSDKTSQVRVGPGMVSVHRLAPYEHWENFLPRVEAVFVKLRELGISDIRRLGLRYINRFEIPLPAELTDYFALHPTLPLSGAERLGPFQMQAELHDPEQPDRILIVNMTHGKSSRPKTFPVIVDLNRLHVAPPRDWRGIQGALEEAHTRIKQTFESFITDRMRNEILGGRRQPDAPAA